MEDLAVRAAEVLEAALRSRTGSGLRLREELHLWMTAVNPGGLRPKSVLYSGDLPVELRGQYFLTCIDRAKDTKDAADRLRELIARYEAPVVPPPLPETPAPPASPDRAERVTTLTSMLVGAKLEQPAPDPADERHPDADPPSNGHHPTPAPEPHDPPTPRGTHPEPPPAPEAAPPAEDPDVVPDLTPPHRDHVDFRNSTFHAPVTGSVAGDVFINHPASPHPAPTTWPTLGAADPLALGVRAALRLAGWPRLTEYVNRDVEDGLEGWFEEDGLLVITGRQFAGKTRTAWEALFVELPPETRVYTPSPGTDLRDLPRLLKDRPGRYVLWLDDLDAHLRERDLDPTSLAELRGARVPVVGTMSDDVYEAHMAAADTLAHRVLAQARVERLSTVWSAPELERAGSSADPRLVEALEWRGTTGVTQYLALAPLLARTVHRAAGARSRRPLSDGLLLAAIDLVRCGMRGDIPLGLVTQMQSSYTYSRRPETGQEEWDKVFAEVYGITGLLMKGTADNTCRLYGSLVADALREPLDSVPAATWRLALKGAADDPEAHHAVRSTARAHFTPRAEAGDPGSMYMLGLVKEADGDAETALHWYRKAADGGLVRVSEQVGRLLLARGAPGQALPYLRQATDHAPTPTAHRLLAEAHLTLAEQSLHRAADTGDRTAAAHLGDLELRLGDASRAAQYYLRKDQPTPLARNLAAYHVLRGETETAQPYLERAAHDGDDRAVRILDDLRAGPQTLQDAESYFRGSTDPQDLAHLGVVLERSGRSTEALQTYDEAAAQGDAFAQARAEALRRERDTVDE
ncbi:hypothetical protein IQ63_15080 [Streptomyces acidiscabies]|uniref:Tetratricopeptide repeat protein n=1 Tax=Streptomyces acidiscabies TaxID=42234 RepID=A0A0L0KAN9_9ACTN|nr:hypothetical protein IQ63_15080 [Streptomyces acidiscabies]